MNDIVTKPLILNKKSRSSRFSNWSGDANSFRDKLFRGIYIFLLFAMDLCMFVYSINGRLVENGSINGAVVYILGFILVISLALIMLLSFSKLLQNLVCSFATVLFVVMFFYQFGAGNVDGFLDDWFKEHAKWLSFLSIVPSPWLIGVIFGVIIFFVFRYSDAILFVTLVLLFSCCIGIQKNEHINVAPTEYQEVKPLPSTAGEVRENKIVYMMLPKFPSYQFFSSVRDTNFRELRDLIIGFYATNNFEIYPNAFVYKNDTMSNIIDILNQVDYTSTTSANRGYANIVNDWNFVHGGLETISLVENRLYEFLRKSGFGVSMYAMPGFNFCLMNGGFFVDRCVVKSYRTVSLYNNKFTKKQNVNALLGEWLLSFKNRSLIPTAKMLINSSPLRNMKIISENRRVSMEGSAEIFEKLTTDFMRDQDGQVYLAYIDLPSDIYIYDEYCNIKPREQWLSLKDNSLYTGGIDEKRKAYSDQMKCLVGKLQLYMDEIYKNPELSKTDIFIQGVSPLRELAGMLGDSYSNFVANQLVNLAIRKGTKPRFLINANICLASDFTKTLIRFQDYCYTLENMKNLSTEEVVHLKKNLINNSVIRGSKIVNIVGNYHDWYENFKANNVAYQKNLKKQEAEKAALLEQENQKTKPREDLMPMNLEQVRAKKEQYNANIFVLTDEETQEISEQNDKGNLLPNPNSDDIKNALPVIDAGSLPVNAAPVAQPTNDVVPNEPVANENSKAENAAVEETPVPVVPAEPKAEEVSAPVEPTVEELPAPVEPKVEEAPVSTNEENAVENEAVRSAIDEIDLDFD